MDDSIIYLEIIQIIIYKIYNDSKLKQNPLIFYIRIKIPIYIFKKSNIYNII